MDSLDVPSLIGPLFPDRRPGTEGESVSRSGTLNSAGRTLLRPAAVGYDRLSGEGSSEVPVGGRERDGRGWGERISFLLLVEGEE